MSSILMREKVLHLEKKTALKNILREIDSDEHIFFWTYKFSIINCAKENEIKPSKLVTNVLFQEYHFYVDFIIHWTNINSLGGKILFR